MIIGIDHGYYAMKTPHICFPTGLSRYDYEPYTMQNVLQYAGNYYVCGTGRQTLMKDKTANDNYYLLTMAALAQEIEYRRAGRKGKIILAARLPLAGFGREKTAFRQYLFRKEQPLCFRYENEAYELTIEVFFVKHFSLKKALKFPVFIKGFSLLSAGIDQASLRMRACSIR